MRKILSLISGWIERKQTEKAIEHMHKMLDDLDKEFPEQATGQIESPFGYKINAMIAWHRKGGNA